MDFSLTNLLDEAACVEWLAAYLHPHGLRCPRCGAAKTEARRGGTLKRSRLQIYRCKRCDERYTLYTQTVFAGKHYRAEQAVMLLRGITQGEPSAKLARELGVSRPTILLVRHEIQRNAEAELPQTPVPDRETETDEMFQNAGEKRRETLASRRPAALSRECPPGAWHLSN